MARTYKSGTAGNDTLVGSNDDILWGGAGGDDTYIVSSTSVWIAEQTTTNGTVDTGGLDTIVASVSYVLGGTITLSNLIENLTLSGIEDISGQGNKLNNVITGNTGANYLSGGEGNDTLIGGAGNDSLAGGTGVDVAWFDGNLKEYIVLYDSVSKIFTITDTVSNRDGMDSVSASDVENFRFADGVVATSKFLDNTAPTVSAFNPADAATGVLVDSNIVLTFNEAIQRGTGKIEIRSGSASGTVVESFEAATSSRLVFSGATLAIDPAGNLANNTSYFVTFVSGSVKDLANNNYAGTTTYDFRTVADTTAPTVTTFAPVDGATGVAVDSNIVLTFSEAIQKGAGKIEIRSDTATGVLAESFEAATSTRLTFSGSTLTIDPTANLGNNTSYFVTFASGSVKDLANNNYAGTTTYDFRTVAPSLVPSVANDSLVGTSGNDSINALGGDDTVDGGAGNDTLNGGDGNDVLVGGVGNDSMDGGAGNDTYIMYTGVGSGTGWGADTIADSAGTDTLQLRFGLNGGFDLYREAGVLKIRNTAGEVSTVASGTTIEQIALLSMDPANLWERSLSLASSLTGGAGNDWVAGTAAGESL